MKYLGITPIEKMGDIWVKREDLAHWDSLDYPSGSKVRQYLDMASRSVRDNQYPPCLVGCSANSCQQIYVAAAAKQLNTKGIIYTAKRKMQTEATKYCADLGAEIVEVRPAYLSYVRKQAHQRAIDEKHVIKWDQSAAIKDTMAQCENVAEIAGNTGIKRIIVPTGSGLTAAGVILGLTWCGLGGHPECPKVLVVTTSPMATLDGIRKLRDHTAKSFPMAGSWFTDVDLIRSEIPYDIPVVAKLPDGTPLDPFYAAKAFKYLEPGDLLWSPGLRPVKAMPEICQQEFKSWKGPQ